MKKLLMLMVAGFWILVFSSPAPAVTFDLNSGLQDGGWYEVWGDPLVGHGSPGSRLFAASLDQVEWNLGEATLVSVGPSSMAGYEYETIYESGALFLDTSGPWGYSAVVTDLYAVNNSIFTDVGLNFDLHLTGLDAIGRAYDVHAVYVGVSVGAPEDNYFPFVPPDGWAPGIPPGEAHGGLFFEELTMTITPIPEPMTLLLMGSGMMGLAGLRRAFRKR